MGYYDDGYGNSFFPVVYVKNNDEVLESWKYESK